MFRDPVSSPRPARSLRPPRRATGRALPPVGRALSAWRVGFRVVVAAAFALLLAAGTAPSSAATLGQDPVDDCIDGPGACQHFLHAPWDATADPCWCDRCREAEQHDGKTVPRGMDPQCFASRRVECYLKRHSSAWRLACSECARNEKCCPLPHPQCCPSCETGVPRPLDDDLGRPARETVRDRLAKESELLPKSDDLVVLYNRRFYVVTDVSGIKVKLRGGGTRTFDAHEFAHLVLERAEMARKEFVRGFGNQVKGERPIGIYLPAKKRDAGPIQARYFGSKDLTQFYGGGKSSRVADGMCVNGFCASEEEFLDDDRLHVRMRHAIGHALVSCWTRIEWHERSLPRWMLEGTGHWLSRSQDRFRDLATFCAEEGSPPEAGGKGWERDLVRMAGDPKLPPIEAVLGRKTLDSLTLDDQKRAWSWFDLCLREWREPFVALLEDLRREKDARQAFLDRLGMTPEAFDARWKARIQGRVRSMSPADDARDPSGPSGGSAADRVRRSLAGEQDLTTLAAKVRSLGAVADPGTVDVLLDLVSRRSDLIRETVMVTLLKTTAPQCEARIPAYGLAHADAFVRGYAARLCGRLEIDAALPALRAIAETDRHWFARAEAALALGALRDPGSFAVLRRQVATEQAERARAAVIEAIGAYGEDIAETAVPLVTKHLAAPQWQVRAAAAQALGRIGSMGAVEPLVARMESESGRVRHDARDALAAIVRRDLGPDPAAWRTWWDAEKAASPSRIPKRPEPPKDAAAAPPRGPQPLDVRSERAGFVLDVSSSMTHLFAPSPEGARVLGGDASGGTKLEISRKQVARALGELGPKAHFSIVAFADGVRWFDRKFAPAVPVNTAAAADWMEELGPPEQATRPRGPLPDRPLSNHCAALRAILELGDGPDESPDFRDTPDTVTLLTDGVPTVGEIVDAETLVEWYAAAGRAASVRTHVICLGRRGTDSDVLRRLAERSGGQFVFVAE